MCDLSICVSFFNNQQFLTKFIQQLKNQEDKNFECILVDDGSTDDSLKICYKECENDKRFIIIKHDKNLGLGAGRVTGLKHASGKYVAFMDCDDYIKLETTKIINQSILLNKGCEILIFNFYRNKLNKKEELQNYYSENLEEYFKLQSDMLFRVWHKVFKKEIFEKFDLEFYKTISFSEDLYLCTNCFLNTDKISFINEAYYTYNDNSLSMVNNKTEKSIRENISVCRQLLLNKKLRSKYYIQEYIKNDSFNAFGMLIFPNKRNKFQSKPHFKDWLILYKEKLIYMPKKINFFTKQYVKLIQNNHFIVAYCMWYILKIRNILK